MKLQTLVIALGILGLLYSCGDPCDGSQTCDEDCDGVVDQTCRVTLLVPAASGGSLRIDDGPLDGFELNIPPGALAEDTEVSLRVVQGKVVQPLPLHQADDAPLIADLLTVILSMVPEGEALQAPIGAGLLEWLVENGLSSSELVFELEPSGLVFASPARLTLPYASLPSEGQQLWQLLRVGQWSASESSGRLLPNNVVNSESKTISVDIEHFSDHKLIDGISQALRTAALLASIEAAALWFEARVLQSGTKLGLGTDYSKAEIQKFAEEMVPELFCPFQDESLDMSVPPKVEWNELMGELTTMRELFNPAGTHSHPLTTRKEMALADAIKKQPGPVSFARSFELSMELHGNNVWDALLTVHNLGQPHADLAPYYETLGYIDPIITDMRGAHYHMAGLTLLNMFNAQFYPERAVAGQAVLSAYGDEVILSGMLRGAFEPGELLANLIGTQLFAFRNEWSDNCDPLSVVAHFCSEDNPFVSEELMESDTAVIHGLCNGVERTWHMEMDEAGAATMPMVPDSCSELYLEVTLRDAQAFVGDTAFATASSTSTDLGVLTIPGVYLASIEGVVIDDQIPPQPAVNATVSYQGETTQTDANGAFRIAFAEEEFVECAPIVVDATLGDLTGTSAETDPITLVTNVGVIQLESAEPPPVVGFVMDASTVGMAVTRTHIVDATYPVDPDRSSDYLSTGSFTRTETGSFTQTTTVPNTAWPVVLASTVNHSADLSGSYTGRAQRPYTLSNNFTDTTAIEIEVTIDGSSYGAFTLTGGSSTIKSGSQPNWAEAFTSASGSTSRTTYSVTRLSGSNDNGRQVVQMDYDKTVFTESLALSPDGWNITVTQNTTTGSYSDLLKTNESGVVEKSTIVVSESPSESSSTNFADQVIPMLEPSTETFGIRGQNPEPTLNTNSTLTWDYGIALP